VFGLPNSRFDLLTLQESMDLLGISRATIDRWRRYKNLPFIKIGKEIYIDKHELHAWIQLHASSLDVKTAHASPAPASSGTAPRTITIGYQSGAALLWSPLIIKQFGWFEEELRHIAPSLRYAVQWVNAPNGIELVEELVAGRVHIASVGDYPIIISQALSRIFPKFQSILLAFDGKTRHGSGISVVVPAGSDIRQLSELSSTTISTVANSSASCRLTGMMTSLGLDSQQVVHRQMGECLNGIVERRVGASVMWEPYLSWAQLLGAGVPLFNEGSGVDYLTGLIADEHWAQQNEPVVIAYLKAHLRAHEFIRREPAQAAAIVSQASGFPAQVAAKAMSSIRWDASLYSRDLQTLRAMESEPLPLSSGAGPSGARISVNKQYLQYAAEALKLPVLPDLLLPGEWSPETIY
jgi:NitT/TauT family transport system substrate-binding protein